MKKALFSKRSISIIFISMLIVCILGGCGSKDTPQEERMYDQLEDIYFNCKYGEDGPIVEFQDFLKKNFEDNGEHIMGILKTQDEANRENWSKLYDEPKNELKELLQKEEISLEEFEKEEDKLWEEYKKSKIELKNLLSEDEKETLKASIEEIKYLYAISS